MFLNIIQINSNQFKITVKSRRLFCVMALLFIRVKQRAHISCSKVYEKEMYASEFIVFLSVFLFIRSLAHSRTYFVSLYVVTRVHARVRNFALSHITETGLKKKTTTTTSR